MSRSPSARLRGASTVVLLLAATSPLQSQDRPASTAEPSQARNAAADTLETARDEIRDLKAGREARNMSGSSLPRFAAPEWHGGAAAAPAVVRPVRPNPPADARNPNWLVDALQQPDATDVLARDREETRPARPGARTASERAEPTRRRTGPAAADPRSASERNSTGPGPLNSGTITNPLTAYLDDWMTPQDLALLRPGLSGRSDGVLPLPDLGLKTGTLTAIPPSSAGVFRGADPNPLAPAGDRPGALRDNPFLAALNAPAASGSVAAQTPRLTVPAPGPAAEATPSLQSPPSTPPVPRTSDFARPATDEKYFKPLKRF